MPATTTTTDPASTTTTTTTVSTTTVPATTTTIPSGCTATKEYESTTAGGQRYSNGLTVADRVFQSQLSQSVITLPAFRDACFQQCYANATCLGVYFIIGTTQYTCNGLNKIGAVTSATAATESWKIGKQQVALWFVYGCMR